MYLAWRQAGGEQMRTALLVAQTLASSLCFASLLQHTLPSGCKPLITCALEYINITFSPRASVQYTPYIPRTRVIHIIVLSITITMNQAVYMHSVSD